MKVSRQLFLDFFLLFFLFAYVHVSFQIFFVRTLSERGLKRPIFDQFYRDYKQPSFRNKLLTTVFSGLPVASDDLIFLKLWATSWQPGHITLEGLLSTPQVGLHCIKLTLAEKSLMNWELVGPVTEAESDEQRCFSNKILLARLISREPGSVGFNNSSLTVDKETITHDGALEIQGYVQANYIQTYAIKLSKRNGEWIKSSFSSKPTAYQ